MWLSHAGSCDPGAAFSCHADCTPVAQMLRQGVWPAPERPGRCPAPVGSPTRGPLVLPAAMRAAYQGGRGWVHYPPATGSRARPLEIRLWSAARPHNDDRGFNCRRSSRLLNHAGGAHLTPDWPWRPCSRAGGSQEVSPQASCRPRTTSPPHTSPYDLRTHVCTSPGKNRVRVSEQEGRGLRWSSPASYHARDQYMSGIMRRGLRRLPSRQLDVLSPNIRSRAGLLRAGVVWLGHAGRGRRGTPPRSPGGPRSSAPTGSSWPALLMPASSTNGG